MNWQRVTKSHRCPVCGKDSWCMIAPKRDVVLCMRTLSSRPYTLANSGEVGYFHATDKEYVKTNLHTYIPPEPEPVINVGDLMQKYRDQTTAAMLAGFACDLRVKPESLRLLGCEWAQEHGAWAFPMRDGYGNYTGIRLRKPDGAKFAVRGSHTGIFLPGGMSARMALVCEGPTDTAAALTLGYFGIGRPSCSGGVPHILGAVRRLGITQVVIVCDNDGPGMEGALLLQRFLPIRNALLVLPAKDLRKFVSLGGTTELLEGMISQLIWHTR